MTAVAELIDLTALDRLECLRLLAAGGIGRVVCTDGALPTAEPVSYVLDREEIIFRAEVGGRLATAARNAVVAFQTDDFEQETDTGWSVLGVGRAYEVSGARRLAELSSADNLAGPAGHRSQIIAVPLWRLNGRRLLVSGHHDEIVGSV